MEASSKAQMRSQILAGEQDINTLSGFAAAGRLQMPAALPPQHPMYQNGYSTSPDASYSNHDLLTPINDPNSAMHYNSNSRKASMASQSSTMQKFFRRKGGGGNFDEEAGADINEVAGAVMSFSDIAHLRGTGGRYNVTASLSLDTMPIIPVMGLASDLANAKHMTSMQYRKHINHQKKMNLANSARAMSLAGSNPMNPGPSMHPSDARTMSLNQGPRTMSLNSNPRSPPMMGMYQNRPGQMQQAIPPNMGHNMGMHQNGMVPNQYNGQMGQMGQMPPNGPRAMSLRTGNPYPQGYRGPPNARTNSLNSNVMLNGQGPMPQGHVPMDARTQSLTQGHRPMNQHLNMGQMNQQVNMSHMNQQMSMSPQMGQQMNMGQMGYPINTQQQAMGGQQHSHGYSQSSPTGQFSPRMPGRNGQLHTHSNDSLMNVAEEDEEDSVSKLDPGNERLRRRPPPDSLPLTPPKDDGDDEDDIVYKFEEDNSSPQVSRKSTVKKSNSMRVRRLDLFKDKIDPYSPEREPHETSTVSPSFNLSKVGDRMSKKLVLDVDDEEINHHHRELANKFQTLGATGNRDHDVFVTAPEFHSPLKRQKDVVSNVDEDSTDIGALQRRGSPPSELPDSSRDLQSSQVLPKRIIKIKSLVTNTAFNNFRSPSLASQGTVTLETGSDSVDFEPPLKGGLVDDVESRSSVYSSETPKPSSNPEDLQSPSSEHKSLDLDNSKQAIAYEHEYSSDYQDDLNQPVSESSPEGETMAQVSPAEDAEIPSLQSHSADGSSDTHEEPPFISQTEPITLNELEVEQKDAYQSEQGSSQLPNGSQQTNASRRTSMLSRSGSMLMTSKLLATDLQRGSGNGEVYIPVADVGAESSNELRRDKRRSMSSKSKSFIKRLSRSGSRKSISDDWEDEVPTVIARQRPVSRSGISDIQEQPKKKPLSFSKEELAIMTCNNDLQNELQLVTSELALSIKRELALERQLRPRNGHNEGDSETDIQSLQSELFQKSKMLADLQEKLNNERRLRFISEEHAILSEHGQSPSPLKLDYEKNEIYKQLLDKNDLVNQLQDKLEELSLARSQKPSEELLHKFNELLRENSELKNTLEATQKQIREPTITEGHNEDGRALYGDGGYEQAQIMSLQTQRDELREMLTKLTSSQNVELKIAQDRIKTLESQLGKLNFMNDQLSRREPNRSVTPVTTANGPFATGQGGKLQGFDVVTQGKTKFFDN